MIRILIADDQELIRSGLRAVLDRQPDLEVVGEAANGYGALALAAELHPDVVLMDIRMPGMDGLAATEQLLAAQDTSVRVVLVTTFELDEYVYAGLKAGASGFILKDAEAGDLIAAVRAVADGDAMLSPSITRRLIETYVGVGPPAAELPSNLTGRESDVLRLMARGLSNAEIGRELFLSEATIKTHVASLLAKLQVRDRLQAVVLAYETGMVRPSRPFPPAPGR